METVESPSIGRLIIPGESISPNMIVNQVADRFFSSANLDALTLIEDERPKGLVSRPKFFFTLFRRFGFELMITKNLAALLGGTISVFSRFGNGSRFEVVLPYQSQNKEAAYEKE